MRGVILDTNVISELMRRKPEPRVLAWLDTFAVSDLWMTSISITEIERGILRLKDRERGAVLRTQFARITGELFAQRVLSFDRQCAEATATYMAEAGLESKHHLADGIIAGTAIVHRLDVATRNTSDFNPQLVCVVDPWKFAG